MFTLGYYVMQQRNLYQRGLLLLSLAHASQKVLMLPFPRKGDPLGTLSIFPVSHQGERKVGTEGSVFQYPLTYHLH
jgi:hypothetical protein